MRVLKLLLVSCLVLGACGGDDDDDSESDAASLEGQEFVDETTSTALTIEAIDNSFRPQYVEIAAGTTVTFENNGRNVHNVIPSEEGAFAVVEAEDFEPEDTAEIVFDEPGDYAYYCSLHGTATAGMIGGIRVVE
jgi:plastocyanin